MIYLLSKYQQKPSEHFKDSLKKSTPVDSQVT